MKAVPHREIERKFLLEKLPPDLHAHPSALIEQGYLAVENEGVEVRLRQKGRRFFLTAKRALGGAGSERAKHEIRISRAQFEVLWPLTEGRRLRKRRYEVPCGRWTAEVDVYEGAHAGLVVAEVEFATPGAAQKFRPPAWFGPEITGERRFQNRELARTRKAPR